MIDWGGRSLSVLISADAIHQEGGPSFAFSVSSLMTCFTKCPGTSFTLSALVRPARRDYEVASSEPVPDPDWGCQRCTAIED
jgi:hypothetical protein